MRPRTVAPSGSRGESEGVGSASLEASHYREANLASRLEVLYEDNHLVAVFKPAGVLTQGDASGEPSLMDAVKDWLRAKYGKPGEVFLGLLHRLDRPVAGVVLFAKTSKGASRLSEQFRGRDVDKSYCAVVEGVPRPGVQRLEHWLGDSEGAKRVSIADTPAPGMKPAALGYETVAMRDDRSLIDIRLETGRKHQIRAQLARIGHPILGDARYGARDDGRGAIALVAYRLRFRHPIRREEWVEVQLPERLAPLSRWW